MSLKDGFKSTARSRLKLVKAEVVTASIDLPASADTTTSAQLATASAATVAPASDISATTSTQVHNTRDSAFTTTSHHSAVDTVAVHQMALLTVDSLSTEDVMNIFACDKARAVDRLNRPKGREVFLFHTNGGKNNDWLADGYRFRQNGTSKMPKKNPVLTKKHYSIFLPGNRKGSFKKFVYSCKSEPNFVVIHYTGNELEATDFPHGNSKRAVNFLPAAPSLADKLKQGTAAFRHVLADTINEPLQYQPRDADQVHYFKRSTSSTNGKLGLDAFTNLHELAYMIPDFIWSITTYKDLVVPCGMQFFVDMLHNASIKLLSYDTTFCMGDFYMSTLMVQTDSFNENPCIPVAFLIHERKFTETHVEFFKQLKKLCKPGLRSTIVTDGEVAVTSAIRQIFSEWDVVSCWNHILTDVEVWLKKKHVSAAEISVYKSTIRELLMCQSYDESVAKLETFSQTWSDAFKAYYKSRMEARVHNGSCYRLKSLNLPADSVSNNISESFNSLLKRHVHWKELTVDKMVLVLHELQSTFKTQVLRSLRGFGPHTRNVEKQCDIAVPNDPVAYEQTSSDINEKLLQLREALVASTAIPAVVNVLASNLNVVHIPQQRAFSVTGTDGTIRSVRLHPKQVCTCPASTKCCHIIAALRSIGAAVDERKPVTLTKLRRNARKRKDKKSGKKKPRAGDITFVAPQEGDSNDSVELGTTDIEHSSVAFGPLIQEGERLKKSPNINEDITGMKCDNSSRKRKITISQKCTSEQKKVRFVGCKENDTHTDPVIAGNVDKGAERTKKLEKSVNGRNKSSTTTTTKGLFRAKVKHVNNGIQPLPNVGQDVTEIFDVQNLEAGMNNIAVINVDDDDDYSALKDDISRIIRSRRRLFQGRSGIQEANQVADKVAKTCKQQSIVDKENVDIRKQLLKGNEEDSPQKTRNATSPSRASSGPRARSTPAKSKQLTPTGTREVEKEITQLSPVASTSAGKRESLPLLELDENIFRALADATLDESDFHLLADSNDPCWKPELYLRESDKDILNKHDEWLNDRLMYAAMLLLKSQYKHINGFCDPIMVAALRCSFPGNVFVQVVHHAGDHWVTASNLHCSPGVVRIYDSMQYRPNDTVKQQLACLCKSSDTALNIQYMNVAKQAGTGDCGLLAIAYATSLCIGEDPVNVTYDQNKLRQHYLKCLSNNRIEAFPVTTMRTVRHPVAFQITEKIYCICRQLYVSGSRMIQCTSCKNWYHPACIGMSDSSFAEAAANKRFACPHCPTCV